MKISRTWTIVIALLLFAAAAPDASAEATLDQSVVPTGTSCGGLAGGAVERGQTFTAGLEGTLAEIHVKIKQQGNSGLGNLIVKIFSTIDGLPWQELAVRYVPNTDIPDWLFEFVTVDVSVEGIQVAPGDVLAIVLSSDGESRFHWNMTSTWEELEYLEGRRIVSSTYPPDGTFVFDEFYPSLDFGFMTFVDLGPPDPCPNDPDDDIDGDGICGDVDNCPYSPNSSQSNNDGDEEGDACDDDDDNDSVPDEIDNCQFEANPDQADWDGDGAGDLCDQDDDSDGVIDADDQCLATEVGAIVNAYGCSIEDLCPCNNDWKNHGAYVSCVAHFSNDFLADGLITEEDKGLIMSEAGESSCGKNN